MQTFISPWISQICDPQGYLKQQTAKDNQRVLMHTAAPAPNVVGRLGTESQGGKVMPEAVFKYYKAAYQGYEVAVYGTFTPGQKGVDQAKLAPGLRLEADGNLTLNGKLWLPESHWADFNILLNPIDLIDLVWNFLSDPFDYLKLIGTSGLSDAQWSVLRYLAYTDQREALQGAYAACLGLATGVHVAMYPMRQNGQLMFFAAIDDQRAGQSELWNFHNPVVQVADRAMVAYAAKFQNFAATDWRSTVLDVAIMVVPMIAQKTREGSTTLGARGKVPRIAREFCDSQFGGHANDFAPLRDSF